MAGILDALAPQLSGQILGQIGQSLGIKDQKAQAAIAVALPVIIGALAKNAQKKKGAESLNNAIQNDHDGSILDDLGGFIGQFQNGPGAGILKHALGKKRPTVEQQVSRQVGLDSETTGKLFEMLAPVVMGQLGKSARSGGLKADDLAVALGGERQRAEKSPQGAVLKGIFGMLDRDGDGVPDILQKKKR